MSNCARENPLVVRYLNGFVRSICPDHLWTTLYIFYNTLMPLHRDLKNAEGFAICVKGLGDFRGGGLWIQSLEGEGPVCRVLPSGEKVVGSVYDLRTRAVVFDGSWWHQPEEWDGEDRWVISAFVPRDAYRTSLEHWEELGELGFPVSGVRKKLDELSSCPRTGLIVAPEGNSALEGVIEWEVDLTVPCVAECDLPSWQQWHESSSRLTRMLTEEICDAVAYPDVVAGLAESLRRVEVQTTWL